MRRSHGLTVRWLERFYLLFLYAYPADFRRRFGREIQEAFRDRCRAAIARGGVTGALRLLVPAVVDAFRNGIIERTTRRRGSQRIERRGRALRMLGSGVLRQGFRRLRRTPTFALATVSSVALGVGAFAAVASVADGVLLDRLPYASPGDLIWVWRDYQWMGLSRGWLGGPDIVALREHTDVFEGIVAFRSGSANLASRGGEAPEEADVLLASDDFFEVLGVQPALGRGFERGESVPGARPVAVLGHELWQRRYGGDPGVIGEEILVDGEPWTVVGVMSPGFRFVKHTSLGDPEPADIYGTLRTDLASLSPGFGGFAGLARVRPNVARPAVDGALAAVGTDLDTGYFGGRGMRLWAVDLRTDLIGGIRPVLLALAGAGFFLLVILTANLATLLYGRAAERSRDIAVRTALGGSRAAAVIDLVAESLIVAMVGCVLGIILAGVAVDGLLALAPENLPRREAIDLDGSVVLVTMVLALGMALLAGIIPALRVSSRATAQVLRASDPRAGGGRAAARTRSTLVIVQVALSLILLAGTGLVGRSALLLLAADPGFEPSGLVTFRVPLDDANYPDAQAVTRFHTDYLARVTALPGVTAAGAVNVLPLSTEGDQGPIAFPGAAGNTGDQSVDEPLADVLLATPGYFEAMGIRLLDGRGFQSGDVIGAPGVAIIGRALADQFFATESPVGRTIVARGDTLTVIGVAEHARMYNVHSDGRVQVYLAAAQYPAQGMYYALRTQGDPLGLVSGARADLAAMDPGLPMAETRLGTDLVRESIGGQRLTLFLLGGFAGGALLLAVMGIYGVVAGSVIRRTPEIGLRMALGATGSRVLRLIAADGIRVIAIGLVIGVAGALAASRLLENILFGVTANDPLTFGVVAGFLAVGAGFACLLPALRAVRVPPTRALRGD